MVLILAPARGIHVNIQVSSSLSNYIVSNLVCVQLIFRPPNLAVAFSSHISETAILQDGSMRISYDEFRFYIYDMLGSNKARQLGRFGLRYA